MDLLSYHFFRLWKSLMWSGFQIGQASVLVVWLNENRLWSASGRLESYQAWIAPPGHLQAHSLSPCMFLVAFVNCTFPPSPRQVWKHGTGQWNQASDWEERFSRPQKGHPRGYAWSQTSLFPKGKEIPSFYFKSSWLWHSILQEELAGIVPASFTVIHVLPWRWGG